MCAANSMFFYYFLFFRASSQLRSCRTHFQNKFPLFSFFSLHLVVATVNLNRKSIESRASIRFHFNCAHSNVYHATIGNWNGDKRTRFQCDWNQEKKKTTTTIAKSTATMSSRDTFWLRVLGSRSYWPHPTHCYFFHTFSCSQLNIFSISVRLPCGLFFRSKICILQNKLNSMRMRQRAISWNLSETNCASNFPRHFGFRKSNPTHISNARLIYRHWSTKR